jgi:para-aminobenzoate synthetase/4-amino-4-deoxychorismate lyase
MAGDLLERPLLAAFAEKRVDSGDPFHFFKTTHRPIYSSEPARRPDCVDLLFLNERGEVAEGSYHNIIARLDGEWVTPPLSSGLLPGVFREELLARGEVKERVITADQLKSAEEIQLVNSVRKRRRVSLDS